jgi:cellulose synthase/poly-beta-1,6-N-acetylglucosamine synthase-like glycosyltransferase
MVGLAFSERVLALGLAGCQGRIGSNKGPSAFAAGWFLLLRRMPYVSVVIPVLNESQTVRAVVEFALRHPKVSEVIVVGDGSIDGTRRGSGPTYRNRLLG